MRTEPSIVRGATLVVLLLTAGCVTLSEDFATHLADRSLKRQHVLRLFEGDLARFRSCLTERGAQCEGSASTTLPGAIGTDTTRLSLDPSPCAALASSIDTLPADHPARLAAQALAHPVLGKVSALHDALRGVAPRDGQGVTLTTSPSGAKATLGVDLSLSDAETLQDQVSRATSGDGWKSLRRHTAQAVAAATPGSDTHHALSRDHRRLRFIEAYLEAYFRDGRFVAVDFEVPANEAKQTLAQELERHAGVVCRLVDHGKAAPVQADSTNDCSALAGRIYDGLVRSGRGIDRQLVKVSETGFVSRDGSFSAQIPTFQVEVDPLASQPIVITTGQGASVRSVDFARIGSDLVRITLEAIFDAHEGLPAVSQATARSLGDQSLPLFSPPMNNVSVDDFDAMTAINQRSAATVGVTLDRVISGLGPFSLNNEPLEELIVTLITTSVREAVAKASWCWYACDLDTDLERARAEIETRLEEAAQGLETKAKASAQRTLTRIDLALRLHP